MNETLLNLPLEIQIALAGGWLGYRVAYAGIDERHRATDALMAVFTFGIPAILIARLLRADQSPPFFAAVTIAVLALVSSVVIAAIWRTVGRGLVHRILRRFRVHRDDGLSSAWTALLHEDGDVVTASVELKNGRRLYTGARYDLSDHPWSGLNLGADGSVVMIVQKVQEKDEESPKMVDGAVDYWGARYTYVPAGEIASVNIRMKKD